MRKTYLFFLSAITGAGLTLLATPPRTAVVSSSARAAYADIYRQLNLFGEVFERMRADYVEKPEDSDLVGRFHGSNSYADQDRITKM